MLRSRRILVLKSTYIRKSTLEVSSLVVDKITVIGFRCGVFSPALELLAEDKINVKPLIQRRYSFTDGLTAFEHT